MIEGIYHIAHQTDDIAAAIHFYRAVLGAEVFKESVSDRGTKMALLHVGQQDVELLEPADRSELGGRTGLIIDHVGYLVSDINAAMAELRARGIAFETDAPHTSPHVGVQVVCLTRESAHGAVIHLVQARQPACPMWCSGEWRKPVSGPETSPYKELVRREWADAVAGWRTWHPHFAAQTQAVTDMIVEAARVRPGMRVLDIGTGSGEPALTLARAVAPDGHVVGSDLVPGMLTVAEEHAKRQGLTNITFRQADAEALPFPDQDFDLVTNRFGIMYCPDTAQALRETYRVLKPGGRAAFVAWGPLPENPYFMSSIAIMMRHAQLPPPPPDTPNPFRFSRAGTLSAALRAADFMDVHEGTHTVPFPFRGSVEECWRYIQEIGAAAFRRVFAALTAEQHAQATDEVLAAIGQYSDGTQVNFPAVVVVATAIRAAEG